MVFKPLFDGFVWLVGIIFSLLFWIVIIDGLCFENWSREVYSGGLGIPVRPFEAPLVVAAEGACLAD